MIGWHHRLDGHEFEQTLGVGDGQGSLACCSPCGRKESDTTEWLNWTEVGSDHSSFISIIFTAPAVSLRSPRPRETLLKSLELMKRVINWNSEDWSFSFSYNIKFICVTDTGNCLISKTKVWTVVLNFGCVLESPGELLKILMLRPYTN